MIIRGLHSNGSSLFFLWFIYICLKIYIMVLFYIHVNNYDFWNYIICFNVFNIIFWIYFTLRTMSFRGAIVMTSLLTAIPFSVMN